MTAMGKMAVDRERLAAWDKWLADDAFRDTVASLLEEHDVVSLSSITPYAVGHAHCPDISDCLRPATPYPMFRFSTYPHPCLSFPSALPPVLPTFNLSPVTSTFFFAVLLHIHLLIAVLLSVGLHCRLSHCILDSHSHRVPNCHFHSADSCPPPHSPCSARCPSSFPSPSHCCYADLQRDRMRDGFTYPSNFEQLLHRLRPHDQPSDHDS